MAVRNWVEASGDPRFEFASLLPEKEFVRAIHGADWFVIPQKSSVGCSFFPSKLIPSIFAGTPVLAISEKTGPLGAEVAENGIGIVVDWSQLEKLPEKLEAYQQDASRLRALRRNCWHRARAYRRDDAIDRIESLLRALCEDDRRRDAALSPRPRRC